MGFSGVYCAIYDYVPQAAGELVLVEGDVLYGIGKNDDDGWWKVKKKAGADDEDEPVGLVPHNYVEQAPLVNHARAIYEYTRQTDEELSFSEAALLDVFDATDPDWILVGLDGEYGFVPSNYIEMQSSPTIELPTFVDPPPGLPRRPHLDSEGHQRSPVDPEHPKSPVAAFAGIIRGQAKSPLTPPLQLPHKPEMPEIDSVSEDESASSPTLPSRPRPALSADNPSQQNYPIAPELQTPASTETHRTTGGFHLYNINEMVSVMGKRKKMPTTLGVNVSTGVILIAPERAQDDPTQEWTADKMTHYSREGKHVFMELIRPSKSVDFHAGAKDTAEEIVIALGELAGAVRAEGLREVIMAGSQPKKSHGHVLYDFMGQGEDEVTVAAGDEVLILDDYKSDEWWQVRRLQDGEEGVMPSSYIEVTSPTARTPSLQLHADSTPSSVKSTVELNRLQELRLTKEAMKASKESDQVGPGVPLPNRGSSLMAREISNNSVQQRSHDTKRKESGSSSKSKPDPSKVRTWTDRSKSFSVEAQFLGLKDGKIHLHKMNGVKIAVPIAKMSREDLEYVENTTGISLDDDKPLADVKRAKSLDKRPTAVGATVEKSAGEEHDWFQFFLSCDVAVGLCERYAQAFVKDSMDESVLADVDASILRNLGLREGDIIKVMRILDSKFSRDRGDKSPDPELAHSGLFSGPRGALRNNTRKSRPSPATQTNDVVDAASLTKANAVKDDTNDQESLAPLKAGKPVDSQVGFEDDAWTMKPSGQHRETKISASGKEEKVTNIAHSPALLGSLQELSLLTTPLQPSKMDGRTQAADTTSGQGQSSSAMSKSTNTQSPGLLGPTGALISTNPHTQQLGVAENLAQIPPRDQSSPAAVQTQPVPASVPATGGLSVPGLHRPLSAPQVVPQTGTSLPLASGTIGYLQSQVAPPGQSLNEINQAYLQQQYMAQMQQLQPTMTGYSGPQPQILMTYQPGSLGQLVQPLMTGMPNTGPYRTTQQTQFSAIQPQSTSHNHTYTQATQPHGQSAFRNVNNQLAPPLEPQRIGLPTSQYQQRGGDNFQSNMSPQLLQPQKTGPAPSVKFGASNLANKLTPQQTGRKANLAQATPQNPFGF